MKVLITMKNSCMLEIPIENKDEFEDIICYIEDEQFFSHRFQLWIRTSEVASMELVEHECHKTI